MSIVGFDGVEFTAYCDPPLTTVRVPAYEMGRLAAKVLMDAIAQEVRNSTQYCLEADLVVRNSCSELKR
jgi:DNA-binding LacI/PurR family transcriptional regulator